MFELMPFGLPASYGESIAPLAAVKAQVAIEDSETEFDDLLEALRDAAVDMVERYTGVILAPRAGDSAMVWRTENLRWPLVIPLRPITSLAGFSYLDSQGMEQVLDTTTLRVGPRGELLLKANQSWPADFRGANGFAITVEGGFTDEQRPPALVQAVMRFTAHLFRFRDEVGETGEIAGSIPAHVRALCGPFRPMMI